MIYQPVGTVVTGGSRRIGDAWRKRRKSLRLFTPGRYNGLPGMPCPGLPWAYPTKDEIADFIGLLFL
jgi:putative flavoprotein involved in K+ transport